jgi:hypothetical protein
MAATLVAESAVMLAGGPRSYLFSGLLMTIFAPPFRADIEQIACLPTRILDIIQDFLEVESSSITSI